MRKTGFAKGPLSGNLQQIADLWAFLDCASHSNGPRVRKVLTNLGACRGHARPFLQLSRTIWHSKPRLESGNVF